MEADAHARTWAVFLGAWRWHWFATLTFRPEHALPHHPGARARSTHAERADKLFRVWASKLNRTLFGVRWYKHNRGVRWCRATEPHKNGRIHFHALLGAEELAAVDRFAWMEVWEELGGGFARIYLPLSETAVRLYCAKYVTKGGQLELGGPLAHVPVARDASTPDNGRSPVGTDPFACAMLPQMIREPSAVQHKG